MFTGVKRISFSSFRKKNLSSFSRFDRETAVNRIDDCLYEGRLTDNWSVGDSPGGGYMIMKALKAAKDAVGAQHPDPLSVTAYYVNKALENHAVNISVRTISKSKSSTTVSMAMSQNGQTKSEYVAIFGNLLSNKGFSYHGKTPLHLPPRDECMDVTATLQNHAQYGNHVSLFKELEVFVPKNDPFVPWMKNGELGDNAILQTWVRFAEKRKPCLLSLAFFADSLPPPVLNVRHSKWMPTYQLTVHFWSPPLEFSSLEFSGEENSWLQAKFETVFAKSGMLGTDAEIWSHDGKRLLATSRQLQRLMEPRQ
jgi:acyl-CoA thioesterase